MLYSRDTSGPPCLATSKPRRRWLRWTLCLALLAGCSQRTQLLVVVENSDEPRAAYDAIESEVMPPGELALEAGRASLGPRIVPVSFGVLPSRTEDASVSILIVASRGVEAQERVVTTRFRPGRRVEVHVDLAAACDDVVCDPDQACRAGSCESILRGDAVDASSRDGGADAPVADSGCGSCAVRPNALLTCPTGSCEYACEPGFDDCDGQASTGCETELASSSAHCGACLHPCGVGDSCAGGECFAASTLAQVTCGDRYTCARYSDGRLYCWGDDREGALGDGGQSGSGQVTLPRPLMITDAIDLASSWQHSCAVRRDGTVWCWGRAGHGALGSAVSMMPSPPVAVPDVSGVARIVTGWEHSCAITSAGGVACWGQNIEGQLGTTGADRATAMMIAGIGDALSGAAGSRHTCIRRSSGLACFGGDLDGQVGDGPTRTMRGEIAAVSPTSPTGIAAGDLFTCLRNNGGGKVECWGDGAGGRLGLGTTVGRDAPGVVTIMNQSDVSAGWDGACSWTSGAVVCWGRFGATPTPVAVPTPVGSVCIGADHACAIGNDQVWCWGENQFGQLGDGTTDPSMAPVMAALP